MEYPDAFGVVAVAFSQFRDGATARLSPPTTLIIVVSTLSAILFVFECCKKNYFTFISF